MQCIVSQPLPFLVLQNAYLVAKIQIYIGLEQTITQVSDLDFEVEFIV